MRHGPEPPAPTSGNGLTTLTSTCHPCWHGRPSYERLIGLIRARDSSRPVTYATNRAERDQCLDLADIVCVNTYPGWYFETAENIPAQLDQLLAEMRRLAPDAPLLVSEIGAGAIPGLVDQNRQHWTEEYQAIVIDRALAHLLSPATDAIGVCIWHFADCRIGQNARAALGRPRGYNNKGLLDEYRRPKRAFEVAARHLRKDASRPFMGRHADIGDQAVGRSELNDARNTAADGNDSSASRSDFSSRR